MFLYRPVMRIRRRPPSLRVVVVTVLAVAGLTAVEPAVAADAKPRYCSGLKSDRAISQLPLTVAHLHRAQAAASDRTILRGAAKRLTRSGSRSRGATRRAFRRGAQILRRIDRSRSISTREGAELQAAFVDLGRGPGKRCGLPVLSFAPATGFQATPGRAARVDRTLCEAKDDPRVTIPKDDGLNACWDGRTLTVRNRGPLVQQISVAGSAGKPRHALSTPPSAASAYIASTTQDDVIAPGYTAEVEVGAKFGSVGIYAAPTATLWRYAVARVFEGFLPGKGVSTYGIVADATNAVYDTVADAAACVEGRNVLQRVPCAAQFTVGIGLALSTAGLDVIATFGRDPKRIASTFWGLIEEGMFIADVGAAVTGPTAWTLRFESVEAPEPQPTPQPGPQPGRPAPTQPAPTQPAPTQPAPTRPPPAGRVDAYGNYGPGAVGRAMCRGNPNRQESMPGGTASQTFTVPDGVTSLDRATVQIDPDARVTATARLSVNGQVKASASAAAAGDTAFGFNAVPVGRGDRVTLSISFAATFGKIITVYTVGAPGGTFTAANSCPDGAPSVSTSDTGLRAIVSGTGG